MSWKTLKYWAMWLMKKLWTEQMLERELRPKPTRWRWSSSWERTLQGSTSSEAAEVVRSEQLRSSDSAGSRFRIDGVKSYIAFHIVSKSRTLWRSLSRSKDRDGKGHVYW